MKPSTQYDRDGENIIVTADVSIVDLVLGTDISVPHPDGKIDVKIPK
jgi:DnaJ-class molecular chaperone